MTPYEEYLERQRAVRKRMEEEQGMIASELPAQKAELQNTLAAAIEPRSYNRNDALATGIASVLPLVLGAALAGKRGAGFGAKAGETAGTGYAKLAKGRLEAEDQGEKDKYLADARDITKREDRDEQLKDNITKLGLEEADKGLAQSNFERQEARLAENERYDRQTSKLRPEVSSQLEQQYFGKDLEGELTDAEARQLRSGASESRLGQKEARAKEDFKIKLDGLKVAGIEADDPAAVNPKNVNKVTEYSEAYGVTLGHLKDLISAMASGRVATGPELEKQMVAASQLLTTSKSLPGRNFGAAFTEVESKIYGQVIPAFLSNPTKGLRAIAIEEGIFKQDPVRQLNVYKQSLENEYKTRLKSRGFRLKEPLGTADVPEDSLDAQIAALEAELGMK